MPGCGATLQRVPGGTSLEKSNTQVLSSTQRAMPDCAVLGVQLTSSGAGSRGSPNLTMDSLNVARTWRTSATSPLGEATFSVASACAAATASNAANAATIRTPTAHRVRNDSFDCMTSPPAPGGRASAVQSMSPNGASRPS